MLKDLGQHNTYKRYCWGYDSTSLLWITTTCIVVFNIISFHYILLMPKRKYICADFPTDPIINLHFVNPKDFLLREKKSKKKNHDNLGT